MQFCLVTVYILELPKPKIRSYLLHHIDNDATSNFLIIYQYLSFRKTSIEQTTEKKHVKQLKTLNISRYRILYFSSIFNIHHLRNYQLVLINESVNLS